MRLFSFIARRPQRRGFGPRRFPFVHHLAQSALKIGNPLASPFFDFDVLQRIAELLEPLVPLRPKRAHTARAARSEEHTSELQSLMRISYAVFCLKKKKTHNQ